MAVAHFAIWRFCCLSVATLSVSLIATPALADCPDADRARPRTYYCTDATAYISIPSDLFSENLDNWKSKNRDNWMNLFNQFVLQLHRKEKSLNGAWTPAFIRPDEYVVLLQCNDTYSWKNRRDVDFRQRDWSQSANFMMCRT